MRIIRPAYLYSVPHGGPQRKREGYPESILQPHGNRTERLGESHRQGAAERPHKMERRLGKIQARHPSVSDPSEISPRATAEGVRLSWQMKKDRKSWRESREGACLLRTI